MPTAPLLLAALLAPPADAAPDRTLTFPEGRAVGELFVRPAPGPGESPDEALAAYDPAWRPLSPATGTVTAPAGAWVRLVLAGDETDLSGLADLAPDDLTVLKVGDGGLFGGGPVGDEHLPTLARLTNLRSLDLAATGVTDDGLADLAGLTNLRDLVLPAGTVEGPGLAALRPLAELRRLWQIGRVLRGEDAALLAELPELRDLNVDISADGPLLARFAALPHLRSLRVTGDGVTDGALAELAAAPALADLSVTTAPVTGAGLESVAKIETLDHLSLDRTRVTGDGVAALAALPNLRRLGLHFGGGPFGRERGAAASLAGVGRLHGLEVLNLTGDGLRPGDFADLGGLTNLRYVQVMSGPVNDEAAYHLAPVRSLTGLNLADADLTDEGLAFLTNLENLEELQVRGGLTAKGLAEVAALPRLRFLAVSSPYLTESEVAEAAAEAGTENVLFQPYRVAPMIGSAIPYGPDGFRRTRFDREKLDALEGAPAPPLTVENWTGGEPRTLADFRGKVVLVDFWGVWCGPCLAEFPKLERLRERFGPDGFEVVGVHTTNRAEGMADYLAEEPVPWPCAADVGNATVEAYAVPAYPTLYLVDAAGTLRFAGLHRGDLARAVDFLLTEDDGPEGGESDADPAG